MSLALVLVLASVVLQDDAVLETRRLRAEGRYVEALASLERIDDPATRDFEGLEILYFAGDLGGALRVGIRGLSEEPDHVLLLWRSTQLAIDLGAAARAQELARRLQRAVDTLSADEREAWAPTTTDFSQRAEALVLAARQRESSLLRARLAVGGIGVAALVAMLLLARRN